VRIKSWAAAACAVATVAFSAASAQAATIPWSSSFSTGDFTEWSWWGQGQADRWGHIAVENPIVAGVPSRTDGYVASFEVTADDRANGRFDAKLYESFSTTDSRGVEHPPADVSGAYSAWYYIPPDYSVPSGGSANIFQFKQKYADASDPSGQRSDGLWWVQLENASTWVLNSGPDWWVGDLPSSANQPVAWVNSACGRSPHLPLTFEALPVGRWFEIRAEVHHGDRIDFFIDGRPFETVHASYCPVNPTHADSRDFTFGVGNYTASASGKVYIDGASATQLGTLAPTAATTAATSVGTFMAALHGTVNPNGLTTTYWFEYGRTTAYGSTAPAWPGKAGSDTRTHVVDQSISGLAEGVTYHYRLVARNSAGTTYGADRTFTTVS
jgi:hypothetical protein